jgi:YVTN family beta-propeller protein
MRPLNLLILLFAIPCFGLSFVASQRHDASRPAFLLAANKGDHTLSIVDPDKSVELAAIPVNGVTGHEVASSPDGRFAYVPIYGNSGVGRPGTDGQFLSVIDLTSRKISASVDFGKGVRPHCAVFGPQNGLLYVTTELSDVITVIDPSSLKIVDSIPTGQHESHMLAISRDGHRGYTANVGPGTVSVIDLAAHKVLAVIPISSNTQRISISNDDRYVFTSDQIKPQLAVIDTATNQIKTWIPLPGLGYGSAPTRDGRWLVIALINVNKVGVIDLQTMTLARTIDVPSAPQEVLVRPDNQVAYISCDASRKIAVLDLKSWTITKLISAGAGVDGLAWAAGSAGAK